MLLLGRNHELIKNRERTFLTASVDAGDTSLTVKAVDSNAWADNDFIIVGEIGTGNAEILQINGVVTDGTSLTIDNAGSGGSRFAHSINEPVYRIDFNQIEFNRSATDSSAGVSVLATNELQVDDLFTRFEDLVNTTGFGFIRFKNSTTNVFSSFSDGIPYTGYGPLSLGRIIRMVRRRLNESQADIEFITDEDIIEELNEKQRDVAHERLWPFYEVIRSDSLVANQRRYDIDDNVVVGKPHTITVDSQPMAKVDQNRINMFNWDTIRTEDPTHAGIWENQIVFYPLPSASASTDTLNGAISATDTTIILSDASAFRSPGRALIDSEVISYENITSTTTLVGVIRGLEGTTAATHSNGATITERDIIYNAHEEPTELLDPNDQTKIPDPNVLADGVAMELSMVKLNDQVLSDRYQLKYDKSLNNLRDKFGKKFTSMYFVIKNKNDIVTDEGSFVDPNNFPQNLSST